MGEEVEKLVDNLTAHAEILEEECRQIVPDLMREAAATLERVERAKDVWKETAQEQSRLRKAAEAQVEALARDYNELREAHDRKAVQVEAMRKALEEIAEQAAEFEVARAARYALSGPSRAAALSDLAALDADPICGPESGEPELKPCPFCGEAPSVSTYETESLWSHNTVTYTKVQCDECDIAFNTEPGHELQAADAWNRRTVKAEESAVYPVPAGWVLVPIEPTEAILDAFWEQSGESFIMRTRTHERGRHYWRRMISAAPAEARGDQPEGGQ